MLTQQLVFIIYLYPTTMAKSKKVKSIVSRKASLNTHLNPRQQTTIGDRLRKYADNLVIIASKAAIFGSLKAKYAVLRKYESGGAPFELRWFIWLNCYYSLLQT